MRCTERVAQGDELLRVPLSKCWTAAAARAAPEIEALGEELLEAISDASLIALHLLVVRAKGAACTDVCRREHVALLEAAEFETLLDWGPEDLEMLAGSKWAMVAPVCRQDIEEEFTELEEELQEFFELYGIDAQAFLWAHRLLISRSVQFFMEDETMLYVLGTGHDMLNHTADVPDGFEDVCLRSEADGERCLVVRAYRDFEEGEQALCAYSNESNGRLLFAAGFVLAEGGQDAVELVCTFPVTTASVPLFLSLAKGLDEGVCAPGAPAAETRPEFLQLLPLDAEQPEQAALNVSLRSAGLGKQLERVLSFFRLSLLCRRGTVPSAEDLDVADADPEQRLTAAQMLRQHLEQMRAGYPSSLEQDEAALPSAEEAAAAGDRAAQRKVNCLRVLIGEKRIFVESLAYLESVLAPGA